MGLLARFFEGKGIPTASVYLQEAMARQVPAPRMLQVSWPFGHPYGEPNHPDQQAMVLHRLLSLFNQMDQFGQLDQPDWPWRRTEIELPEQWMNQLESLNV